MDETTFAWLRLLAFALAVLPALLSNLRSGAISNLDCAIALLGGVAMLLAGRMLVGVGEALPLAFWSLAAVALIAVFATGVLPGGVVKFLLVLLVWFDDPFKYLAVFATGFGLAAIAGWLRGGRAPAVPGFYVAGLGVLAWSAL